MMAAQNSSPVDLVIPSEGERPPSLGFTQLFHSVEGLHQRLAEFSIDDVARAEDTANTLIRRLALLQNELERIAELKECLAEVSSEIEQMTSADMESIHAARVYNPRIQGIVNAEKVIRLHRFLSAASALVQSAPLDATQSRWPTAKPPGDFDTALVAADSVIISPPMPEEPAESVDVLPADEAADSETPPAVTMLHVPELPAVENYPPRAGDMTADGTPGAIMLPDAISAAQDPASEPEREPPAANCATTPEADFDKRLLDDLIQNYGELVPCRGPQAPAIAAASAGLQEENRPSILLPAIYEPPVSEAHSDSLPDPALPPEPNFVMADSASPPELAAAPAARPRMRNVPVAADIDRQLKEIIADYGHYDLYQRQTSSNFKKSGIVAFIILGLVLFGVYFLKGPKPSVSGQAGSNSPSVSTAERPAEETGGNTVTKP